MTQRWVNGQALENDANRACMYGDGVFETMRLSGGRILFWAHHWQRMQTGLRRLGFAVLSEAQLGVALAPALQTDNDAILRVSVSRDGVRGYRYTARPTSSLMYKNHLYPPQYGMDNRLGRVGVKHVGRNNLYWRALNI